MKLRLMLIAVLALSALPASAITDQYRTGILVHARLSQAEGKSCVTLTVLVEKPGLRSSAMRHAVWIQRGRLRHFQHVGMHGRDNAPVVSLRLPSLLH
jgi:hypothetical protein